MTGRNSEREEHTTSLQGNRDHRSDVLPLEEGVRRPEVGSSKTDEGAGAREREIEAFSSGAVSGEADPEGRGLGKLLSPERRRCAVEHARGKYEVILGPRESSHATAARLTCVSSVGFD